ncbi:MAG: cupin domain-containing protein [Bauldia litoralis]
MAIELTQAVDSVHTGDLIEYSAVRQVRKKMMQSETVVTELVCYEPGQFTKPHIHPNQDEIFFCVEGTGAITFTDDDKEDIPIRQGSVVFVPAGVRHGVATDEGNRLVLMFTKGPGLPNLNREKKAAAA